MTKGELIRFLEPFDDRTKIVQLNDFWYDVTTLPNIEVALENTHLFQDSHIVDTILKGEEYIIL